MILTEMVALSCKVYIVRKLSREFNGQATQTYTSYRRFVLECLDRFTSSWNKDGPVWDKNKEYWTKDVKEHIDQLFRPYLTKCASASEICVLEAREVSPDYDLRQSVQFFHMLKSFCKHMHVRLSNSAIVDLLEGKIKEVPDSGIEEIRVPGLLCDNTRPTRKIRSEHIMSMLYTDALDTMMLSNRGSSQRGIGKQQETSTVLFSLDHIPTETFKVIPTASSSLNKMPLAVVNLLDSEAVSIGGHNNYALITHFAITASTSTHM